ncbi:MAG TPA: hypothetical protein DDZ51_08520 [Planctomycetaceae bacterium]|nr:hypothetical protein [Planctomycetaceae bacterium]
MHIGDQHLDGFLVLALPMAWYGGLMQRRETYRKQRLLGGDGHDLETTDRRDERLGWTRFIWPMLLSVLILHAGLSSMSRATIVVLLAQSIALASSGAMVAVGTKSRVRVKRALMIIGIGLGLAIGGASLAMHSEAISARFETSQSDLLVRWRHWQTCVALTRDRKSSLIIGNGLGTLPTLVATAGGRPTPPVRWQQDDRGSGGTIIMQPGWPLYLERWMIFPNRSPAALSLDAKAVPTTSGSRPSITISRCTKSLLQSYDCNSDSRVIPSSSSTAVMVALASPQDADAGRTLFSAWRPESFAISTHGDVPLELGAVRMNFADLERQSLISDYFSNSVDGWTFTCDDHRVWRAHNIWVHLLFEQGLFGLLAAVGLQLGWSYRLVWGSGLQGIDRSAIATALIGFAAVGCFGTLIDTPWLTAIALSVVAILFVSGKTTERTTKCV